jgi:hypothetical protein
LLGFLERGNDGSRAARACGWKKQKGYKECRQGVSFHKIKIRTPSP